MKLFVFEMKKIFRRRFLLVMIILLLCLNIFNIWQNYSVYFNNRNSELNIARRDMYEYIEGPFTAEKIQWLTAYNSKMTAIVNGIDTAENSEYFTGYAYGDMNISNEWIEETTRIYNYNSQIQQMKADNNTYRQNAVTHGNIYLQRVADKIDSSYSERSIDGLYNYNSFEAYFSYSFSSFLIIIILLLAFSPLFAGEHETGMHLCFMASENGRNKTSLAKISAMSVYIFILCLLFAVIDLITFYFCAGLSGFSAPIYAVESFAYTPFTCSIASFIGLLFFIKFSGFLLLGLIYSLLSSVFNKSYTVFVFGLIISFGLMFMSAYSKGILDTVNTVNPINLITGYKMFSSFDITNIFDFPIWTWAASVVLCLICMFAFLMIIIALNNKNTRRQRK